MRIRPGATLAAFGQLTLAPSRLDSRFGGELIRCMLCPVGHGSLGRARRSVSCGAREKLSALAQTRIRPGKAAARNGHWPSKKSQHTDSILELSCPLSMRVQQRRIRAVRANPNRPARDPTSVTSPTADAPLASPSVRVEAGLGCDCSSHDRGPRRSNRILANARRVTPPCEVAAQLASLSDGLPRLFWAIAPPALQLPRGCLLRRTSIKRLNQLNQARLFLQRAIHLSLCSLPTLL